MRLPRSSVFAIVLALFIASASLFARQKGKAKPEDTVKAFAKALAKDDYPAMARLVVGGKPDFDFRKLRGDDQERDKVYTKFDVKIKDVKIDGDRATVTFSYTSREKGDDYDGSQAKEITPLQLVDGAWKIVPYTKTSPTGYFMERLATVLANPDKEFAMLERAYAPTGNLGEANIKLGKERSKFFSDIFDVEGPENDYIPYDGYKSMTMVEHTSVIWPVGKADEVIFDMGLEQASYLTYWKKVNGKPKRIFQYRIEDAKGKQSPVGTLNARLARSKQQIGKGQGASPRALLEMNRAYASYIEVGAIGVFVCNVIRPDGTLDPSTPGYSMEAITQDSYQLNKRGFFITPAEQMLMATSMSNP